MNLFLLNRDGFCIELHDSLLNVYYDNNFVKFKAEGLKFIKECEVSYLFVARDSTKFYILKDIFNTVKFCNDTIDFRVKITEKEKKCFIRFFTRNRGKKMKIGCFHFFIVKKEKYKEILIKKNEEEKFTFRVHIPIFYNNLFEFIDVDNMTKLSIIAIKEIPPFVCVMINEKKESEVYIEAEREEVENLINYIKSNFGG